MEVTYRRVRELLDKREAKTPLTIEEANEIFQAARATVDLRTDDDGKYYWFAIMNDLGGFNTAQEAVDDALEYLKNGGY